MRRTLRSFSRRPTKCTVTLPIGCHSSKASCGTSSNQAIPTSDGIPEEMSIDQSMHSVFGASKVAADVLVQEYGRYFGLRTVCFRGGCLTGPHHSGTQLHGFLSYLMKCAMTGTSYVVYGYKGKQVRDNIHSADLIAAFHEFFVQPRVGEVYNIGGGRFSNCSMLEAIRMCEELSGRELKWTYDDRNRAGDHIWWISDTSKFERHYPGWSIQYDVRRILEEIAERNLGRWRPTAAADSARAETLRTGLGSASA